MLRRLEDPAVRAKARREIETTIDGWENLILGATFEGIQVASVPPETDQSVVGRRITEIAASRRQDPWDTFFDLILSTGGRVGALFHMMSEEDVQVGLRWGSVSIGTDSAAVRTEGPCHAARRTRGPTDLPRVLGHYARDEQLFPLHEAVRRMTSLAAQQFRIRDRGVLRPACSPTSSPSTPAPSPTAPPTSARISIRTASATSSSTACR